MRKMIGGLVLVVGLLACSSPTAPPLFYLYQGVGDPSFKNLCDGVYFKTYEPYTDFQRNPLVDPVGYRWNDVCCSPIDHGFHWTVGNTTASNFGTVSVCI